MCSIIVVDPDISGELPRWFLKRIATVEDENQLAQKLGGIDKDTLCNYIHCPNMPECYSDRIAAFQILGNACSRNCGFCSVPQDLPSKVDESEVQRIADAARILELRRIVLVSAPRDDLIFGGAGFFSRAIKFLKKELDVTIEAHVPDFRGSKEALQKVVDAGPDVITHNLETVQRLYPAACPKADYNRSLKLLAEVKEIDPAMVTKSGIMLGLGETDDEILKTMEDLRKVDCDLLTIGQYVSPSKSHLPIHGFVLPKQFKDWEAVGRGMGFKGVASAPSVRSSYQVGVRNSCNLQKELG